MSYKHHYTDGTFIHYGLGKIVCVGRNYAEHAKELNNPVPDVPLLFIKPGSCAACIEGGFKIPHDRGAVHFEGEIAVLIGKPLSRNPSADEVKDAISGFAPALDLTLRDLQNDLKAKGHPWERAKAFDGACVLSPFIHTDAIKDLADINLRLSINGEVRQDGNSRDMIMGIIELIQHIAGEFSLYPGDVVLTGTPAGVGELQRGDKVTLELVGLTSNESEVL